MTAQCQICSKVKPKFHKPETAHLIKSTQAMERLNVDFKRPLPSATRNKYLFTVVDEFSRFPFAIPCPDTSSRSVINALTEIFALAGTPGFIHSDRGAAFISTEVRDFLHARGIATSCTTPYNPRGNGQCERYNGNVWKGIQMAMESKRLPLIC